MIEKIQTLAKDLTDGKLIRVRFAPHIHPVNGDKAYLAQGKEAGLVTTQSTSVHLGVVDGAELWEEQYPFAMVRPVPEVLEYGRRTMSAAEACGLLGIRVPTFVSRCSRSDQKAWPRIGGIFQQCSIAEPYPHVFAYRVDPRGHWNVTLFGRSVLFRQDDENEQSNRAKG